MKYPNCMDTGKFRHMTPEDLDEILDYSQIHFNENIMLGGEKCQGLCVKYKDHVRIRASILLDPNYYCTDETLVHEGAHVFYRTGDRPINIDFDEGENSPFRYVLKAMTDKKFTDISRKHYFEALEDPKNYSVIMGEGEITKETMREVTNEKYRGKPLIDAVGDVLNTKTVHLTDGYNFPDDVRWWSANGQLAGYNNPDADDLYVNLDFDPLPQILMHEVLHEVYPMLHEAHIKQIERKLSDPKNDIMKLCRERVIEELDKLDL